MNEREGRNGDYRFLTGLTLGSIVGVGLTMLLAPRAAAEIKARAVASAKDLGDTVSEGYRHARLRVADSIGGIARKGQGIRNQAFDTVARAAQGVEAGARGVQHFAVDAKTKVV